MGRPKKQNAEYFSHDADMRNDDKVLALRSKYEHKGYSIWCMFLEILTNKDNFVIELKDDIQWELLAGDIRISEEETKSIINFCVKIDLLQSKNDKYYCEKLIDRLQPLLSKRENMRQKYTSGVVSVEESIVSVSETTQSKVKESKVNINIDFDVFWNKYNKKVDKDKCEKKWLHLKNDDRQNIINSLDVYIKSTPDKQYRKNPTTYLNNRSWENEIITRKEIINEIKLSDGSVAIKKFGEWQTKTGVKIDLRYYPELKNI